MQRMTSHSRSVRNCSAHSGSSLDLLRPQRPLQEGRLHGDWPLTARSSISTISAIGLSLPT